MSIFAVQVSQVRWRVSFYVLTDLQRNHGCIKFEIVINSVLLMQLSELGTESYSTDGSVVASPIRRHQ